MWQDLAILMTSHPRRSFKFVFKKIFYQKKVINNCDKIWSYRQKENKVSKKVNFN